jgi:phosphatidylserine/phosphatidylglycerophosphate/cardiolipin synthase-like enzyme
MDRHIPRLLFVLSRLLSPSRPTSAKRCPSLPNRRAYFSRRGGAADSVIEALNQAQKTIHVAMYGLTNAQIVDTLIATKQRGVDVALKTDKIQSAGKTQAALITRLEQAGVPVEVSEQTRLVHHKFAVIDSRYVITGSFN